MKRNRPYLFHLRAHDKSGNLLARGGVSIVVCLHEDDTATAQMAICTKNDAFCKRIGGDIAHGRFNNNPIPVGEFNWIEDLDASVNLDRLLMKATAACLGIDLHKAQKLTKKRGWARRTY